MTSKALRGDVGKQRAACMHIYILIHDYLKVIEIKKILYMSLLSLHAEDLEITIDPTQWVLMICSIVWIKKKNTISSNVDVEHTLLMGL